MCDPLRYFDIFYLQEKVRDCRQTLTDLQRKIEANEDSLNLITASCSTEVAQAKANMEQMKVEQKGLTERLEQELARKEQLEAELEADRLKIVSLENRLQTQEEQVLLSLKLSQDLKEQRAYLASEEERLKAAEVETEALKAQLQQQQKQVTSRV